MIKQAAIRFALISALIWIAFKYVVFLSGSAIDWFDFSVMANNFMLLLAISLAIFFTKKEAGFADVSKREDIKIGIKSGMIYTVVVVLFGYYYNSYIDSSVLDERIAQRMEKLESVIQTEDGLKLYREQNPQASALTVEQIINKEREATVNFLNPRVSALLNMMFFTLLTIFYAAFITIVIRKIYLPGLKSRVS